MKVYKKAILPIGFKANAIASGIKRPGKLDLGMFYSDMPAKAACKFSANKIQAAHIKIDKRHIRVNKGYQTIIVNSGNANSFTGGQGERDAEEIVKTLAKFLAMNKERVLIASTGIIGKRLPLTKIKEAIPGLVKGLSRGGVDKVKVAIMTTDTFAKEIAVKLRVGKRVITVCGIAKGAGMIAPNLATMLVFIMTDANITQGALNKALKIAVDNSFNCITVDGCMSTNDTVCILANGASGNNLIGTGKYFEVFLKALNIACLELAKMIINDAEGATKFIRIKVDKAKSVAEAKKVALAIANYNLFKAAMYGQNPNFGRIIAAVGSSGINVKEKDIKINVSPLHKKNIDIQVSLKRGNSTTTVYTSDLTPEYIKINAAYN